jgi:glucose-6-phosphate 1-dehydrogenase
MKNNQISAESKLSPVSIVFFGATGDLVWRKLAPALYNLLINKQLPEHFTVIGIGRKDKRLRKMDGVGLRPAPRLNRKDAARKSHPPIGGEEHSRTVGCSRRVFLV